MPKAAAAVKQDPNRLLVVPKAPGPIHVTVSENAAESSAMARQRTETAGARPRPKRDTPSATEENNYRNSLLMSASVSAPSLPIATASQPKPLPAKLPLRSALRNSSRTPSPNPPPPQSQLKNLPPAPLQPQGIAAVISNGNPPLTRRPVGTMTILPPELMMKRRESDISSISSYETGHEVLDEEPYIPTSPTPPSPPPPPPHDEPVTVGSELSTSTSTASTATPPVRRKSVRMSLPPTFSATPPALDDTDEDEDGRGRGRHEPWSPSSLAGSATPRAENGSAWGSRIEQHGARDVWEDSSDEDAEYSAAKRLLTRLSRKHEH